MKYLFNLTNLFIISFCFSSISSAIANTQQAVETFGRIPLVKEIKISPAGTHVAYLRDVNGSYYLLVQNLYKPGEQPVVFTLDKSKIRGFSWVSNDRIVFTATRPIYSKGDKETFTMHRTGILDTTNNKAMWPFTGRRFDFNIGRPVLQHKLPNDPNHILMSYYYTSASSEKTINALYKVRLSDGERDDYFSEAYSNDWVFDINGNILAFTKYDARADEYLTKIRQSPDDDFELLMVKKDEESVYFEPKVVRYLPKQAKIYYFDRTAEGFWQMYSAKINGTHVVEAKIVSDNAIYDIDTFIPDQYSGRLLGYTVMKDYREYSFIDPQLAQVHADLVATFPNSSVDITSYNVDKTKFMAQISSFEYPQHYYLYDTEKGSLSAMGQGFPIGPEISLGKVSKFEYKASDGLNIESYLTLPASGGLSDNEGNSKYKLIVLPHGGPATRDNMEFDWMRQFFASQGYAVFQPNFRGSEGYGKEFEEKGHGEWGKRMQSDVDEGVEALISSGIIAKEHICVVGASYGGYVAMYAAATKPNFYKCAVSFAGVSELGNIYYHAEQQLEGLSYWTKSIGERYNAKELDAYSPLDIVQKNSAPMLLMHGKNDTIVPIFQSEKMYKRLKELKVKSDYIEFEEGDHWFSNGETRQQFLKHTIKFVNQHIN